MPEVIEETFKAVTTFPIFIRRILGWQVERRKVGFKGTLTA